MVEMRRSFAFLVKAQAPNATKANTRVVIITAKEENSGVGVGDVAGLLAVNTG